LHRSQQGHDSFLGLPFYSLPVPGPVVSLVAALSIAALGVWVYGRFQAWRRGEPIFAHTAFLITHHTVFLTAYLAIQDINIGWLTVNIWHNAQYVLFVWVFNVGRFKDGIDPKARFISAISQPSKAWLYFTICLAISTTVYFALDSLLPAGLILATYMTINFHHYIVDSVIWKIRRKPIQQTLGIR
jgi:hypothetical protein